MVYALNSSDGNVYAYFEAPDDLDVLPLVIEADAEHLRRCPLDGSPANLWPEMVDVLLELNPALRRVQVAAFDKDESGKITRSEFLT